MGYDFVNVTEDVVSLEQEEDQKPEVRFSAQE